MTGAAPSDAVDLPVSDTDFAHVADALELSPPVAVAVSGGSDSMALLWLAHCWSLGLRSTGRGGGFFSGGDGRFKAPAPVTALTVDHGLRPEAAREAVQVSAWAHALGMPHYTLSYTGPRPQSNVQAEARAIRYRLLEGWCRRHGVPRLLVGHTIEDQAETFLLRLARGSGADGLGAMAPRSVLSDEAGRLSVELVRPLLGLSRARLRATLRAEGIDWIEDPSNRDDRYARVRMRQLLAGLSREGITPERLATTAQRMQRVRGALEDASAKVFSQGVAWDQAGFALLDQAAVWRAPEEVGLRVLRRVIRGVGGQPYPPRHDRLMRLYEALGQLGGIRGRTLGGCRFTPLGDGDHILVTREIRHLDSMLPLAPGGMGLWDGRFRVSLPRRDDEVDGGVVRALGREGLRLLREAGGPRKLALPAPARSALPALWRDGNLIAVPQFGFDPEQTGFRAIFIPGDGFALGHLDALEGGLD